MPLQKCHECGHDVSTDAAACPNCGAKPKPPSSGIGKWIGVLVSLFVVFSCLSHHEAPPPPREKTQDEKEADVRKEAAFQVVVSVLKAIQHSARNPDSLTWESVTAAEDSSVVCVVYRGQNGFGGMSREASVYAEGRLDQDKKRWNKYCASRPLNDMIHARHAL